ISVSDVNSQRLEDGHAWGGFRDPVVAHAIENVTGRHQAEDFWAVSSHETTEAIYDEIRRLDQAKGGGRLIATKRNSIGCFRLYGRSDVTYGMVHRVGMRRGNY